MSKIKDGKLPLGSKSRILSYEETFGGGSYELPADVAADFEKKGLVPKWLNGDELIKNHGRHKRGWKVYVLPENMRADSPFSEKDGTIRNGDSVLGYKTKEQHEAHKLYLQQRAELQSNRELVMEQFEREAARHGVKVFREK